EELFRQYSTFMMTLRRSHLDRRPADVDWAAWSASLTSASLVAPVAVARAIDAFGQAIETFLDQVTSRDPVTHPMDEQGLTEASRPAAAAHLVLLNSLRRSLGPLGEVPFSLGGTLGAHPEGRSGPAASAANPV